MFQSWIYWKNIEFRVNYILVSQGKFDNINQMITLSVALELEVVSYLNILKIVNYIRVSQGQFG
jgi:hypothetical protein